MTSDKPPPWKWRRRAIAALDAYFERRSYPRTMLTLLLLLAGAAGFLVSYGLLRAGVDHMWMRYPIAVLAGYAVLLALVRGWVELEKRSFDPDDPVLRNAVPEPTLHHRPSHRWWDWLDLPLDVAGADEGCIALLVVGFVALVIGGVFAAIAAAPALIAEVFLDAFLVTVLYRRRPGCAGRTLARQRDPQDVGPRPHHRAGACACRARPGGARARSAVDRARNRAAQERVIARIMIVARPTE